jgi:hypothetical protein
MIFKQALTYQDSEAGFVSSKSKEPPLVVGTIL